MQTAADHAPAVRLTLDGLSGPVVFDAGTEAVADGVREVLVGWPKSGDIAPGEPCLVVRRQGKAILVTRCRDGWHSKHRSVVSAVCTAVVEIVADHVDGQEGLGSLHAAAAEFAGRLVVFPALHRAGKSTLMTALSAGGRRIFADDLLPVDLQTLEGVATGCLPRLRLPLPESMPPGLPAFVAAHTVASDGYYAYVAGGPRVAHGERAPIGAVVLLDRQSEPCAARLDSAAPDEALLGLLMQDARDAFPAGQTLDRYHQLVSKSALHRLTYFDLGEAIDCLDTAFSSWPDPIAAADPPTSFPDHRTAIASAPDPAEGRYRRSPAATLKVLGTSAFLVNPDRNDVHHLNAMGLGLWNLLERPMSEETIVEIFLGAFPDQAEGEVRRDVAEALDRLKAAGLVEDLQL